MSTQKLLGLPSISPELKPIVPFLQRAEELKKQEPIIAYWCAYYAAQVGIGLKARDSASRDVLFSLLGVLEDMKKEIGSVDAIEIEAASAAFVENFALRVFQSADSEDRNGAATRITAKKFLAASNFLEVLKTFPKVDVSESYEDKIRYAKWKAADISKALREGRRPVAGPAGQEEDQTQSEQYPVPSEQQPILPQGHIEATHLTNTRLPSPPRTAHDIPYGSPPTSRHRREGSGGSTHLTRAPSPPRPRKNWVSDEVEGKISPSSSPPRSSAMKSPGRGDSPEGKKQVHFSSSADVVPSTTESPPKVSSPAESYQGPPSIYAAPADKRTPSPPSRPPADAPYPSASYSPPRTNIYGSPNQHQPLNGYSPPQAYPIAVPPAPAAISPPQVELTPQLIARAQKHCRFAISSLDYEDAEQAKKELRTALALLGGL
ncbi:hypothetical protein NP233_g8202 [Leucocoprinus birnbaumii]|uniref:DUF605-domain-containing protein n=1 Tax=Leucocoprinus birnbaumii TaxID=56174 RepID=A0AAD5YTY3_9AGAR|nr:hypothetical protein NP233_g8202 [Leucocoprinus birnbaumii]